MIDFEKASINALKYVYPNATLTGCLFHLSKSLYSKLVDLGYKQQYHTDNAFSLLMRHFTALAFVQPHDVTEFFEELSEDDRIPSEFISYFEMTYIGVLRGRRSNRRRDQPMFPIELWNVYARTEQALPRTNNNVETFHNALNISVSNSHPNLWKLILSLKLEESLATAKRVQFERGDTFPRNKKYADISTRIKHIVDKYNTCDHLVYLKSISYTLRLF